MPWTIPVRMNNNTQTTASEMHSEANAAKLWQDELQKIVTAQDLHRQRQEINKLAVELNITVLDCAAALLYLNNYEQNQLLSSNKKPNVGRNEFLQDRSPSTLKLVRYRLDLGSQHQLNLAALKKVIVEESGVDINNIFNVRIQDSYTLVDLPDEMPQEIFHHLKTVEINGHKLDIRRVKARNKKHSGRRRKAHRTSEVAAVGKANNQ
jgi:DbpA RNA binding domain